MVPRNLRDNQSASPHVPGNRTAYLGARQIRIGQHKRVWTNPTDESILSGLPVNLELRMPFSLAARSLYFLK
jgi:hypothetical protein